MLEVAVGVAITLSLFAIASSLSISMRCEKIEQENKKIKHQVCEHLTSEIPAIVRRQVRQSLN